MMEDLITELGTIRSWYEPGEQLKLNRSAITEGHRIIVETVDYSKEWPFGDDTFTVGRVYRYFIEKRNSAAEKLILYCQLTNPEAGLTYGGDPGQCLDAIMIEGIDSHLHIGTQDAEEMYYRLEKEDEWVPKRLLLSLNHTYGYSAEMEFGLKINVPALLEGEKIYFHFTVVADKNRPSRDFPGEDDISTWHLANLPKKFLDEISPLSSQLTEASQNGS